MEPIAKEINELTGRLAVLLERRNAELYAAVQAGESVQSAAERYDISRQRAHMIITHLREIARQMQT